MHILPCIFNGVINKRTKVVLCWKNMQASTSNPVIKKNPQWSLCLGLGYNWYLLILAIIHHFNIGANKIDVLLMINFIVGA